MLSARPLSTVAQKVTVICAEFDMSPLQAMALPAALYSGVPEAPPPETV